MTTQQNTEPTIFPREFESRRKKVLAALKKSIGILFAGDHDPHLNEEFRPHPHFEYLTGVVDEPGAVLVLDPACPIEARQVVLLLPPLNPEAEAWDGLRLPIGSDLRDRIGMKAIFRLNQLPRLLTESAKRCRSLACLHPLASYDQPVSPDMAIFQKICERVPGTEIVDQTEILAKLRSVKSRQEIAMIQHSIDITSEGFDAVIREIRPGMNEFEAMEILQHGYRTNGSRGPAFGTIVGSGLNSTVLHYRANDQVIEDGDLICIDSGASYGGYGADITRTVPANGTFTKRQREIYETVLKAEMAAIKTARAGIRLSDIDRIARAVITKAGFGDYFIHSIGHHLGLETHDVAPDEPLRVGAVITIEPGIYIPDEKIGVRIEDDVVITKSGCRNLSARIPKSVAAIEKMMEG